MSKFNSEGRNVLVVGGPLQTRAEIIALWPWKRRGYKYVCRAYGSNGDIAQEGYGKTPTDAYLNIWKDFTDSQSVPKEMVDGVTVKYFTHSDLVSAFASYNCLSGGSYLLFLSDNPAHKNFVIDIAEYEGDIDLLIEARKALYPGRYFTFSTQNNVPSEPEVRG